MIIKESSDKKIVLFEPETPKERTLLENSPAFLREGLFFYTPSKQNVVYNVYCRLRKKIKDIKYTPFVRDLIERDLVLSKIPEDFHFHTAPLKHQEIALRFAYTFESIGLLLEPGLGKTKVVLDFIYLKKFRKSLIVCPLALTEVWVEEVSKHRPELSIHIVTSTNWEVERVGVKGSDITVVNYNKAVILEDFLRAVGFEFMAIDEGLIKNHASNRTKSLTAISLGVPSRMIMSGTLVNNSPMDIFAPIRFIEPSLVGRYWTRFKNRYAVVSVRNRNIIMGFHDVPEIKDILHSCSIVMTKAEWLKDLPEKKFHKCIVQMGDNQRHLYHQLASNYLAILEDGTELEVDNALSLMSKLSQIANGFLYISPEADEEALSDLAYGKVSTGKRGKKSSVSKRRTFFFNEQPKIKELLSITDDPEKLKGRRSIIWFNMTAECDLIERALLERGDSFLTIRGSDPDLAIKVRRFNSDPSIRWLVCQAKTINYGQTVMGDQKSKSKEVDEDDPFYELVPEFDPKVSDEIFYSMNFSLEMFLQQQDRIHRIGQTRTCNYWIIMANCSVEKRIVSRQEEKLICNRQILEDIATNAHLDFQENI